MWNCSHCDKLKQAFWVMCDIFKDYLPGPKTIWIQISALFITVCSWEGFSLCLSFLFSKMEIRGWFWALDEVRLVEHFGKGLAFSKVPSKHYLWLKCFLWFLLIFLNLYLYYVNKQSSYWKFLNSYTNKRGNKLKAVIEPV